MLNPVTFSVHKMVKYILKILQHVTDRFMDTSSAKSRGSLDILTSWFHDPLRPPVMEPERSKILSLEFLNKLECWEDSFVIKFL